MRHRQLSVVRCPLFSSCELTAKVKIGNQRNKEQLTTDDGQRPNSEIAMSGAGEIVRIDPAALPGGEVLIECRAFDTSSMNECQALFAGQPARLVGASPTRVLALVPEEMEEGGTVEVRLASGEGG